MRQEDTRKRILERALELFSLRGYDSVSMGEIAGAVGIKAPSLYNHFASKQAIFDAIVESTVGMCEADTEKANVHVQNALQDIPLFHEINEDDLCKKVRQLFVYSLHNEQVSRFRRMMTIEQFRSSEFAKTYANCFVTPMIAYHADVFRALIAMGQICSEDPEVLAVAYVSPVLMLIEICDRQPERERECLERLEGHVRFFFRMLKGEKAPRGEA